MTESEAKNNISEDGTSSEPHSLKASHLSHASSYLGYKDKSQDEGGTNEESSAEESGKCIDKILQGVGSNDNDCEYNAGHISGWGYGQLGGMTS